MNNKTRNKEEGRPHSADAHQEKNSLNTILVILVLATILLAVSVLSSININFPQRSGSAALQNKPDTYVWITGSSSLHEGLYLFSPELLKDKFPGLLLPVADTSSMPDTGPRVYAIQYKGGTPEMVSLPPPLANIFFRPISLNRADKNILSTLPGIGPVLAERIVQQRTEKGPIRSANELLQIPGIGPGKLAQLLEHILFD
jgi:hypothetical protein